MASKEHPVALDVDSQCTTCKLQLCICAERGLDGSWTTGSFSLKPSTEIKDDQVNSPQHYKLGNLNVEAVDVVEALLTPEEFRGWLKGNRIKYCLRAGKKDNESQDLEKECWFAKRLIEKNKQ